ARITKRLSTTDATAAAPAKPSRPSIRSDIRSSICSTSRGGIHTAPEAFRSKSTFSCIHPLARASSKVAATHCRLFANCLHDSQTKSIHA
ncbi:hypothetical protein OC834_006849, partial [Tilletia horrida]